MSEHFDTRSVIDSTSPSTHITVTLVKWRPFGRPSNRHAAGRAHRPNVLRLRVPVSLGEVEGVSHMSFPRVREINSRSSRRGKEQIRSKTSREVEVKRSDLRVGDSPRKWIRETSSLQAMNSK